MTTLTVSTDGASIIRPTYGRFPISSSSSGPTESIPNIDIDLGVGKYIFNSTGGATEDNRTISPLSSFTIDSSANANFYVSNELTDGTTGNIVGPGSKPQNWGLVYFGITYQDQAYWNTQTGTPNTGHSLAGNDVIWYLDFDDYPEYASDLVRGHNGYAYQSWSANNEFGFSWSRSGTSVTVKAFRPDNNSVFYTRTATIDANETVRLIIGSFASSSNVYGTYNWVSQSGNLFVDPPVSIPAAGLYENPNTITESWPSSGYTAPSLSFYDRKRIQVSAENTITHAPKHFRKTIECIDNTVPFNLSELRKLDGTQRQYQIARAISSDGGAGAGGGGGGGTAEIQTWY